MATVAALPVAANVVAEAFVKQYYTVLHSCPENAHRFYTDASRLTRAEAGPDGVVDTVITQNEIHNKMMAQDYLNLKAEIRTIDCQESLTGGVLVMVTGSLSTKVDEKRNFVQSFFLAPQERGFFVLNDIFRYLDEEPESIEPSGVRTEAVSNVVETLEDFSLGKNESDEVAISPVSPELQPADEELHVPEVQASEIEEDQLVEEVISHPEVPSAAEEVATAFTELVVPSLEEVQEQTPKKSYASILRHMKENPGSQATAVPNVVPKSASVNMDRATTFVQAAPLPSNVASANEDAHDETADIEHEGDGRSIYVKNLPMSITASELHEEFVRFGPIKSNGINVRSQKQQGFCYAFLEFEDATAAQSAIDASPIIIGGRPAHIQEKKPGSSRATGSRLPLGRGDRPYRPDSGRGRAYFGGRGQGRAPGQDRERDTYFRGRGSGVMRGGYNGSQNVNVAAKTAPPKSIK